ncbi:MAG TPA: hypothetical protein VFD39_11085 [Trueperaceae bacterium]|nr:hypothetical protein [Trueperaceae bacterium]
MARHGEYKTVGGKLVVVDVTLAGGEISNVAITGDFFLEPAEALEAIAASLTGAPANASEEQLSDRVTARLPAGVEMIGFSPQAIATAVRRAIDDPTPRERV